jgi:hypothetical protein
VVGGPVGAPARIPATHAELTSHGAEPPGPGASTG